ncbi:hypothetical protein L2E82_38036 [Cichorium intybus]|uniref:Uncharacterized protein n=1 Tax=Cichorium intybus TaxID=13427 RepID=A0ACB9AFQ8_CICIN|nr:hypothetical protein L2E82_38036 [Cichorium intybus]
MYQLYVTAGFRKIRLSRSGDRHTKKAEESLNPTSISEVREGQESQFQQLHSHVWNPNYHSLLRDSLDSILGQNSIKLIGIGDSVFGGQKTRDVINDLHLEYPNTHLFPVRSIIGTNILFESILFLCSIHYLEHVVLANEEICKETDSNEKATKEKRGDSLSDPGFRRSYVSPSPAGRTPRVPFTQPRRRDWERADSGSGGFRKLHFGNGGDVKRDPAGIDNVEASLSGGEMTEIPSKGVRLRLLILDHRFMD